MKNILKRFFINQHYLNRKIFSGDGSILKGECNGIVSLKLIQQDPHLVLYKESGHCLFNQKKHRFHQERLFSITENKFIIRKKDFSILHSFLLSESEEYPITLVHSHTCGEDIYKVTMTLTNEEECLLLYKITGPHKNEKIVTTLRKK